MNDPYNLKRFMDAQEPVLDSVTRELREGRKQTHWMWFVFPQFRGLGTSPTAQFYAINSVDEARAFISHPVLGRRLRDWTRIVVDLSGRTAEEVFGYPDYLKFRSSVTLFDLVAWKREDVAWKRRDANAAVDNVFRRALEKYYGGEPDDRTLRLIRPR